MSFLAIAWDRQRRAAAVAAVVMTVAAVAAGSASGAPAHASSACAAVTFLGAAGSGEGPGSKDYSKMQGLGAEVYGMDQSFVKALGSSVSLSTMHVDYAAASTHDLEPVHPNIVLSLVLDDPISAEALYAADIGKFFESIQQGTSIAVSDVKALVSSCPSTLIVLAGYSQGAMVMHQAELQLAVDGDGLLTHVAGTMLLADGDRAPNTKAAEQLGTAPAGGEGIRPYLRLVGKKDVPLPATTADICNKNDFVCDFTIRSVRHIPTDVRIHTSYATSPLLTEAANWIAGLILSDLAPPPTPPTPPTPTPPTPAPVTVPGSGPTMVYQNDSAGSPDDGDLSFSDWESATSEDVDVEDTLPSDLASYRCVVLDLNESFNSGDEAQLADYLQAGGTIVALGEHSGVGFDAADQALNSMIGDLGAGITINDDSNDPEDTITPNIDSSLLTTGVSSIGYNWASSLSLSGAAQELVASADDSYTLIGEQAVQGGTIVVSGDSNAFSDNNDDFYEDDGNSQLVENLCP
jgi:cutinase